MKNIRIPKLNIFYTLLILCVSSIVGCKDKKRTKKRIMKREYPEHKNQLLQT